VDAMSNLLVNNEVVIDPLNSCLDDYNRFIKLSSKELDSLQKNYSSELHQLQAEFDTLLNELRAMIKPSIKTYYLNCA
jgi:hypothetical protein